MLKIAQMLRTLLVILFMLLCPTFVWAQEEFCGHPRPSHDCPVRADQACQCLDHDLCLRLASEKPGPSGPARPRFEFLCPRVYLLRVSQAQAEAPPSPIRAIVQPLSPSLAPEPPPPRACSLSEQHPFILVQEISCKFNVPPRLARPAN